MESNLKDSQEKLRQILCTLNTLIAESIEDEQAADVTQWCIYARTDTKSAISNIGHALTNLKRLVANVSV